MDLAAVAAALNRLLGKEVAGQPRPASQCPSRILSVEPSSHPDDALPGYDEPRPGDIPGTADPHVCLCRDSHPSTDGQPCNGSCGTESAPDVL